MIFEEISFYNFKVYRGNQKITLTPPSKSKPIILFGGLNGGGKTSIIEGIQLALYGKLSSFAQNHFAGYSAYLKRVINREALNKDRAFVELTFKCYEHGIENTYTVNRSWYVKNDSAIEAVEVYQNGEKNQVLSDTWLEQVERFIPVRLSHLFFFDGERIEALADAKQSAALIETGINSLLGLDLVEKLNEDMLIISHRKTKETSAGDNAAEITQFESELQSLNSQIEEKKEQVTEVRTKLERKKKELGDQEKIYAKQGGNLADQKEEFEKQRETLTQNYKRLLASITEFASGALPLALVSELLNSVLDQAKTEQNCIKQKQLHDAFKKRDKKLIEFLTKKKVGSNTLDEVVEFLNSELVKYKETSGELYLKLPDEVAHKTEFFLTQLLPDQIKDVKQAIRELQAIQTQLDTLDGKLLITPDAETLNRIITAINSTKDEIDKLSKNLFLLEDEFNRLGFKRIDCAKRLEAEIKKNRELMLVHEDSHRIVKHSMRVKETLDQFKLALRDANLGRLQNLIMDGYSALLRKKTLVKDLEILKANCEIQLFNKRSVRIDPDSISAGERQLLAVAILWGLGRASARPLPVIVDTPLGRLDSSHRHLLVKNYFPHASHQVLLLSTDEEITEKYYETLSPYVGREYHIKYDDDTEVSTIEPGYFGWSK